MMSTDDCGRLRTAARPRGRGIRRFGLIALPTPPPLPPPEEKDRVFMNDIQQEAKEEVPKEHAPAITAASQRSSSRGGESPKPSASSSSPKALKTPAAFLNEICAKSCSKYAFQFDNMGNPGTSGYFKCTAVVTAKNGNIIEGSAFGTSKQVAKQDAARNLLLSLDPQTDTFLTPKDPSKKGKTTEAVEERRGCQLANAAKQSQEPSQPVVEKDEEGAVAVIEQADPGNAWGQDVIYMSSADGTISLAIPKQLAIQQLSPYQIQPQLSLEAKMHIVRSWEGPKIQRLKGMTLSEISRVRDPSKVAEIVSESEGLMLNYILINLEGEEGGNGENRYHCVLEARDSTMSYFTHSGFGGSQEESKKNSALNYLQMLWSIISAV